MGERLRRAVATVKLTAPPEESPLRDRATVSVGVASICEADRTLDDLLRRADAALYEAKQAGRDRVVGR